MKTLEPRLFRANTAVWAAESLLPTVFFAMLGYTIISHAGVNPEIALLGLGLVVGFVIIEQLVPVLRSWIQFGRSSIEGSVNGRSFQMYYGEVLAAWLVERRRKRFLCLGTRVGTVVFPLHSFNHQDIWSEVSLRLPVESLGVEAVRRLTGGQTGSGEKDASSGEQDAPRTVADHWTLQIAGWSGITLAVFSAVTAIYAGDYPALLLCGGGVLACLVLLLCWGITEIGPDHIRRSTMFISYSISWVEVMRIERDPFGIRLVLIGEDCRLAVPGPCVWSQLGKDNALEMFESQARERQIPVEETVLALFKFSRRTRMVH